MLLRLGEPEYSAVSAAVTLRLQLSLGFEARAPDGREWSAKTPFGMGNLDLPEGGVDCFRLIQHFA
jgi:hypothetical protein